MQRGDVVLRKSFADGLAPEVGAVQLPRDWMQVAEMDDPARRLVGGDENLDLGDARQPAKDGDGVGVEVVNLPVGPRLVIEQGQSRSAPLLLDELCQAVQALLVRRRRRWGRRMAEREEDEQGRGGDEAGGDESERKATPARAWGLLGL
jgi:hypothetical protein